MPDDSSNNRSPVPSADTPLKPWSTPEARAARRLRRELQRNYYKQVDVSRSGHGEKFTVRAATAWLLPWQAKHYPGILRGLRQILDCNPDTAEGARVGVASVASMARLADLIEARSRSGAAIASALRDHIAARPRKVNGLQIIDAATGLRKHQKRGGRSARSAVSAIEAPGDSGEVAADRGGETKL